MNDYAKAILEMTDHIRISEDTVYRAFKNEIPHSRYHKLVDQIDNIGKRCRLHQEEINDIWDTIYKRAVERSKQ